MSKQVSFLRKVVDNLIEARERAVQRHVRQYLRSLSDRQLADMGFSRELLEQGPEAWPWHTPAASPAVARWEHGQGLQDMAEPAKYDRRESQPTNRSVTADDKLAA